MRTRRRRIASERRDSVFNSSSSSGSDGGNSAERLLLLLRSTLSLSHSLLHLTPSLMIERPCFRFWGFQAAWLQDRQVIQQLESLGRRSRGKAFALICFPAASLTLFPRDTREHEASKQQERG